MLMVHSKQTKQIGWDGKNRWSSELPKKLLTHCLFLFITELPANKVDYNSIFIFGYCLANDNSLFLYVNSSYPGQNGRHFADDIFKRICASFD